MKVFVDTAAVMEKPLAEAAGLGWQGKHTNLVSRQHRLVAVPRRDLHHARPAARRAARTTIAARCRACLDVCPTAAFPAPYRLDARRCISYLTIEHKGPIPRELRAPMGNRIYGCDDCLAVCPWNKFAQAGREAKLCAREATCGRRALADLARLDDAAFRALFAKSPVKRIGRDRFVRNVLIAIGNSGDATLAREAERLLDDASPLVRGAAVWALGRLDPRGSPRSRATKCADERRSRPCGTSGRPRSQRQPPDGDARLSRPRLLRPPLRRRVRRALRAHRRHDADARESRGARGAAIRRALGRDAGVRRKLRAARCRCRDRSRPTRC